MQGQGHSSTVSVQVWDLPLRLFHWLLVVTISVSIISGQLGGNWMDWHGRAGLLMLGLLVFRLVWGLIGPTHARFCHFFPTPGRLCAYFKGQWNGQGHSPLGAVSVFAMLAVMGVMVGTGLFANDDITFNGPLSGEVSKDTSDSLSGWHARVFWLMAALIVLHIVAIAFYAHIKKRNLVKPMITGRTDVPADAAAVQAAQPASRFVGVRFIIAVLMAAAVVWGVVAIEAGVFDPPPPPQSPAAVTPDW